MTKKQRELLNYIVQFIREHGYSPSYREIMNGLGYKSVSTVATHVEHLVQLGHIKKSDHNARTLEVVGRDIQAPSEGRVTQAQHKWLVDHITQRFTEIEATKKPEQQKIDDLFVLVGALDVLGFKEPAAVFKAKLKKYL